MNISVYADENLDDEPVVVSRFEDEILVLSPEEARSYAEILITIADFAERGSRIH